MKISEKLQRIRKHTGLSQENFAHSLGVTSGAVYKWESGDSMPGMMNLKKIMEIYKININEILRGRL